MQSRLLGPVAAIAAALALSVISTLPVEARASAESTRAAARSAFASHADAVVTLRIVHQVSFSFGGRGAEERENQSEALGTVITPDGLIVADLSEVDPGEGIGRQMVRRMGGNAKFETKIKEVTIITGDNRELPAVVVLREQDTGLAFLRPREKPSSPMTHVAFAKDTTASMLDELFTVFRMGEIGRRQAGAVTGEVMGVIQRPRLFFIPSSAISEVGAGTPVFNAAGQPLGIQVDMMRIGSNDSPETLRVIRPAADVLEYAALAPTEAVEAAPVADADESANEAPADSE